MDALPFLLLTIVALLFISLPIFKKLDETSAPITQRVSTLDGLRGFLAFAVFINHLDSNYSFIRHHQWSTYHVFNGMLGPLGVSFFFMITGYLFYGKIIESDGAKNWFKFLISRFFRIAPAYYLTYVFVLIIVLVSTSFSFQSSPVQVITAGVKYLALGIFPVDDLNKVHMERLLGVIWTLKLEWYFYFSLPILAFLAKKKPFLVSVIGLTLILVYIGIGHSEKKCWIVFFFCGMLCAALKHIQYQTKRNLMISSFLVSLCLISIIVFFHSLLGVPQIIILLIAFYLISNGSDLFGLLKLKGAKRLGNISYSLYLLHMAIIYVFLKIPYILNHSFKSEGFFWIFVIPCALITITIASLCYYLVEKEGIQIGKRLLKGHLFYKRVDLNNNSI
ncbi:acyltransferase family protein [Pedobacter mucosus]|uniref:acyltransferase family protein n=1 Tax=Pedobacter mucosus TaxID=2895286 RepID=UPI001EE3B125|nr:acyltransferase [Pedobacter mucosus]UKT65361.1 acyltransferase [Pedobacter mucosus]